MRICSTFGTVLYAGSLALGTYALLTLGWSTANDPTLTVDGAPTNVFMRMGPFGMRARVAQGGILTYAADSYLWCARADPGPIFDDIVHERALCGLLLGSQIAGVASLALGLAALFLAFLLSCNSIKNRERKHTSGLLATLMFVQMVAATGCVGAWVCLHQIAQSDLDVAYPNADLYFGRSFWAMATSAILAFLAFVGAARSSTKERRSETSAYKRNRAALEDDEYKGGEEEEEEGLQAVGVNP